MTRIHYSASDWMDRATDARRVAAELKDPEAQQTMLQIAESYERLAKMAQTLDQLK